MGCYLAIDIGTQATKAVLYSPDGVLRAGQSASYPITYPQSGWAEQDPLDWWEATRTCCHLILEGLDEPIVAVSLSGQAPSCLPIDPQGRPLRSAILWLDRRSAPQVALLHDVIGAQLAIEVSGNRLDSYYGGLKWAWFMQNEPHLYEKSWKISQANGYVGYRLTGEIAIDPSQAGLCSPCFNLGRRQWDAKICDRMGLDVGKLPPIVPSTEVIGRVTARAAVETGLPAGIPVVCGGGDFACACLGAGVFRNGTAAMMLGTAGNLLVPEHPRPDTRLFNTIHVTGQTLSLGGVMAGGAVSWFKSMLGSHDPDLFDVLEREASQTPPGAGGLIFLPYLMGERTPIWDPDARGVFVGLSADHGRGHLYRAVMEGVAYAFRQVMAIVVETGTSVDEIVAINGGARSQLWRQILADVLEVPIRWRPTSGGTELGAAFLAAQACDDALTLDDLSGWLEPTRDTWPMPDHARVYQPLYEVYASLYGRLHDCFPRLKPEI
jgi:xylulokinase